MLAGKYKIQAKELSVFFEKIWIFLTYPPRRRTLSSIVAFGLARWRGGCGVPKRKKKASDNIRQCPPSRWRECWGSLAGAGETDVWWQQRWFPKRLIFEIYKFRAANKVCSERFLTPEWENRTQMASDSNQVRAALVEWHSIEFRKRHFEEIYVSFYQAT